MKIRQLHMVGFKSFVDPTTVRFDTPTTCIVGPNGCGKSNVVDAIRWVMGEMSAKSLRGKAMEDVIFAGSEGRAPVGMAEVSLTFSTEDGLVPVEYASYSEITVTRRLFRSGESEYLINKTLCRLKDIVELFLGTGVGHKAYSVIEQGKIDFAINAKPEDRRRLIEEAAGISKFKMRKEAALRKIEATKNNLARLSDILREVRRQIASLDRQVKKAERYRVLRDELRTVDLTLATHKMGEMNREEVELEALYGDWNVREATAGGKLAALETSLETRRLTLVEKEQEISSLQEQIYELSNRIGLLQARGEFSEKEKTTLKAQMDEWLSESQQAKERLLTLSTEQEGAQEEIQAIAEADQEAEALLHEAEEQLEVVLAEQGQIKQTIEEEKNILLQTHRDMAVGDSRRESLEGRKIDLKGRLAKTEAEISEIGKQCALIDERTLEIQRVHSEKTIERNGLEQEIAQMRQGLVSQREAREMAELALAQKKEEVMTRRSRLRSLLDLERNFEGYQDGVRSIFRVKKQEGKMAGVLGVVADYVESAPQYEVAVTAALGEKLQSILVESHDHGVDAISYLKSEKQGRSMFIPLEMRETEETVFPQSEGVIGPLLDLVKMKGDYERLGRYLFGDIVLVESLSRALSLWRANGHKKTLVTLDGEVVYPDGVVSGGHHGEGNRAILEKKREIKELKIELADIEAEMDWKEDYANQKAARVSSIEIDLDGALKQLHDVSLSCASLQRDLEHEGNERKRYQDRQLILEAEQRQLQGELETIAQTLQAGLDEKGTLSGLHAEKEQVIARLEEQLKEIGLVVEQRQLRLMEFKVRASAVMEKKRHIEDKIRQWTLLGQELKDLIDKRLSDITTANQRLVHLQAESEFDAATLTQSGQQLAVIKADYETRKVAYEALGHEQRIEEASTRDLRKEFDLSRSHTSDLKVTMTQLRSDREHLLAQITDKYSLDLSAGPALEVPADFDVEAAAAQVVDLKDKIDKMGDVNLGSIPEYQELKERNDFLTKQYEDLEQSVEALSQAITRINQTTKKRFVETLNLINEKFETLFPKLFKGGSASISLTDPNDLLNSGVDIMVQPPGKRQQHLSLLSGGEKALSATALVFSIFLVKPSPFCILDEVDAPLDDTNVDRFLDLIRDMTSRSQFILISHNKRTMEMVDTLYGVTMEEPGSSKIVSVKLNS